MSVVLCKDVGQCLDVIRTGHRMFSLLATGDWCRLVDMARALDVLEVATRLWDLHALALPCMWSPTDGFEDRADVVEADDFEWVLQRNI